MSTEHIVSRRSAKVDTNTYVPLTSPRSSVALLLDRIVTLQNPATGAYLADDAGRRHPIMLIVDSSLGPRTEAVSLLFEDGSILDLPSYTIRDFTAKRRALESHLSPPEHRRRKEEKARSERRSVLNCECSFIFFCFFFCFFFFVVFCFFFFCLASCLRGVLKKTMENGNIAHLRVTVLFCKLWSRTQVSEGSIAIEANEKFCSQHIPTPLCELEQSDWGAKPFTFSLPRLEHGIVSTQPRASKWHVGQGVNTSHNSHASGICSTTSVLVREVSRPPRAMNRASRYQRKDGQVAVSFC